VPEWKDSYFIVKAGKVKFSLLRKETVWTRNKTKSSIRRRSRISSIVSQAP
jgi:hypothetical protein